MEVVVGKVSLGDVDPIDVARMVGSIYGYHTDLEPMEPGKYRLRAASYNRLLSFNGTSIRDVCDKFVNALIQENKK